MCFGARRAYGLALSATVLGPCSCLGPLLHNPSVSKRLAERGLQTVKNASEVSTKQVLIPAHGTTRAVESALIQGGHDVKDATCPRVKRVQNQAMFFQSEGYYVVLIGKQGHAEMMGVAGNLSQCTILREKGEIDRIPATVQKIAILSQTTESVARVKELVDFIRQRFPQAEVLFENTLCEATCKRQTQAALLAERCSVMVVIGGGSSHNTAQLTQACLTQCPRVYQVEMVADLRAEWFCAEDYVGIVAGASTPPEDIVAVEEMLVHFNDVFMYRRVSVH